MLIDKFRMLIFCFSQHNKVRFGKHINVNSKSVFEGKNYIAGNCSFLNSELGYASYVANGSYIRNTKIGKYSCIGKNVRIVDVTHPTKKYVSIHPVFFAQKTVVGSSYIKKQKFEEFIWNKNNPQFSVILGNDVWVGDGAMILGGRTVGNGAIIAAGAVVTKDVNPYEIVAGVPAKVIGYRFEKEEIDFLEKSQWWNKDEEWMIQNAEMFEDIEIFLNIFSE